MGFGLHFKWTSELPRTMTVDNSTEDAFESNNNNGTCSATLHFLDIFSKSSWCSRGFLGFPKKFEYKFVLEAMIGYFD